MPRSAHLIGKMVGFLPWREGGAFGRGWFLIQDLRVKVYDLKYERGAAGIRCLRFIDNFQGTARPSKRCPGALICSRKWSVFSRSSGEHAWCGGLWYRRHAGGGTILERIYRFLQLNAASTIRLSISVPVRPRSQEHEYVVVLRGIAAREARP